MIFLKKLDKGMSLFRCEACGKEVTKQTYKGLAAKYCSLMCQHEFTAARWGAGILDVSNIANNKTIENYKEHEENWVYHHKGYRPLSARPIKMKNPYYDEED